MSHTATAVDPSAVLSSLRAFVCQRPGFDLGNYATLSDYRADYRQTLTDRDVALDLIRYLEWSTDPERLAVAIADTLERQSGGRLEYDATRNDWDYTAGQYWCVEYRAAAVRLLASIVAEYWTSDRAEGYLPWSDVRQMARRSFRPATYRRAFPR